MLVMSGEASRGSERRGVRGDGAAAVGGVVGAAFRVVGGVIPAAD